MSETETDPKIVISQLTEKNYSQASKLMEMEQKINNLKDTFHKVGWVSTLENMLKEASSNRTALELKLDNQQQEIIRLMGLLQEEHLRVKQYQDWHWQDVLVEIKTQRRLKAALRLIELLKKRDNDMTNAEVDTDNVVQLNSHAGGKDNGGNWLINLPEGTVFLTREIKTGNVTCIQFHLKMKWNRGVLLHSNFPHGTFDEFFDSENFCKKYDLIDIQQTGTSSDNLDTRPRDVENHVNDVS